MASPANLPNSTMFMAIVWPRDGVKAVISNQSGFGQGAGHQRLIVVLFIREGINLMEQLNTIDTAEAETQRKSYFLHEKL